MKTMKSNTTIMLLLAALISLGNIGCERTSTKVKDALNMRDHEAVRDAAEDLDRAAASAAKAAREEGYAARESVRRAVEARNK